jgi:hypothetical protein
MAHGHGHGHKPHGHGLLGLITGIGTALIGLIFLLSSIGPGGWIFIGLFALVCVIHAFEKPYP